MKAPADEPDAFQLISEGARSLEIVLNRHQIGLMAAHAQLVLQWRSKADLTALRGVREIISLHFLDSLTLLKVLPSSLGLRVLDVGTGAGFPGLVLKVADDSIKLTLMDRDPRKIVFLKYAVSKLQVVGVEFLNSSLNDLLVDPSVVPFDLVVSRAFSSKPEVLDSFCSLLNPGGYMVRMAGPSSTRGSLTLKHFHEVGRWEGILPFTSRFRRVVLYKTTG